ncbi:uncharacterized protein LOC100839104 [Brachypodium distachyon]|nr:uncharacterized protein LOC100839104 [Brachypodium distachyon]|eukprot:XP_024317182.1 uncharacterized protein LOC100839104 [Brachypodium distachyon]
MDDDVAGNSSSHDGMAAGCSSCLPFCFWSSSRVPAAPERRRRRRRRLRLRLSLSWFSWPWRNRKSRGGKGKEEAGGEKRRRKKLLRLRLMLLTSSSQAKKAFASVSSGSIFLPKVSSFGGAKKQNRGRPRRTVEDEPTTSCAAPVLQPETTSQQPCPSPSGETWRAPSSRLRSLQPDLWAMATTLGAIVFVGRVAAVFFLCSCMYGARWWFGPAAQGVGVGGGSRRLGGDAGVGGSWRLGDRVAADLCTGEHKRKVVMDGLLERASLL